MLDEAFSRAQVPSDMVLVVDDEESIRKVQRALLERHGYGVLTADDGEAALSCLGEFGARVGCVLLDLTMPGMSGKEVLAGLRAVREDIPVVLVTGYSGGELEEQFRDLGFAGFLKKPVRREELVATVERVMGPPPGRVR